MRGGEFLEHILHEPQEPGHAFLRFGHGLPLTALTVSCLATPLRVSFTAAMISVLSALRSMVVAGMLDGL